MIYGLLRIWALLLCQQNISKAIEARALVFGDLIGSDK